MSKLKNSLFFKLFIIFLLIIILIIPTFLVNSLIDERMEMKNDAIYELGSKWGSEQTITGPYISIPYTAKINTETVVNNKKTIETSYVTNWIKILPDNLNIKAKVNTHIKKRGIYQVPLYTSNVQLDGTFLFNLNMFDIPREDVHFDKAKLLFGISDLKGIKNDMKLVLDSVPLEFLSEMSFKDISTEKSFRTYKSMSTAVVESKQVGDGGITARVPFSLKENQQYSFKTELLLNGNSGIFFNPLGSTTNTEVISNWKNPKFDGHRLTDTNYVSDSGFYAKWTINHLNRPFPKIWLNEDSRIENAEYGVSFLPGVDNYQKTYRVAKYAILFIVITYLVFFFIEVLSKIQLHPIQYLLVGFAIIIFYLLVLSISEHLGFDFSYLLATIGTLALVTLYSFAIFKSKRLSFVLFGILLILYSYFYFIIQLEDYALLFGSLFIFIVLAIVMYISRKIDWFNVRGNEVENELAGDKIVKTN